MNRLAAQIVAITGIAAGLARAQCSGYVLEPGPGSFNGYITAMTLWDPDGPGSSPATLVAAVESGGPRVLMWDGAAWQQLGPTFVYSPASLTVFGGELLVGMGYGNGGGPWSVGRWNGSAWEQYGAGINADVRAFTVHQNQLWAFGGAEFFRLSGTQWQSMGPIGGFGYALTSFQGELIGGGQLRLGTPPVTYGVLRWGGAPGAFSPVGDGWVSGVFDFAFSTGGHLVAAGAGGVAQWSGAAWQPIGPPVYAFTIVDFGGLIVGGPGDTGLRKWDGAAWQTLAGGVGGAEPSVNQLLIWNRDLIIGGGFTTANGQPAGAIARYRCIPCPANCDNSTSPPILNANDFQCFLNKFAAADSYANCDGSTSPPVLNANDFQCYLNQFAAGCP